MKIITILFAFICSLTTMTGNAQAKQSIKKETVKVWGNCEMCQSKIEKAAKAAGATTAQWDVDSKILAVSFSPGKSSVNKIEKAIAAAGYDTEHEVTTETAFDKLPGCCKYERKATDKEGTEAGKKD